MLELSVLIKTSCSFKGKRLCHWTDAVVLPDYKRECRWSARNTLDSGSCFPMCTACGGSGLCASSVTSICRAAVSFDVFLVTSCNYTRDQLWIHQRYPIKPRASQMNNLDFIILLYVNWGRNTSTYWDFISWIGPVHSDSEKSVCFQSVEIVRKAI